MPDCRLDRLGPIPHLTSSRLRDVYGFAASDVLKIVDLVVAASLQRN